MVWLVRIVVILLAAVILALGAFVFLPGERIARIAADQIELRTGRDLVIEGDLRVTIWPVLGVQTGPIVLGNANWATAGPMLEAEGLSIGVSAPDLLRGQLNIRQIIAQGPVLRLEEQQGRQNWRFGSGAPPAEARGGPQPDISGAAADITLERLELRDARLVYVKDGAVGFDQGGVTLAASWPDRSGPLAFRAGLQLNGESVDFEGKIADLPAFLSGSVAPVGLTAAGAGADLSFDGRASGTGDAAGALKLRVADAHRLRIALRQFADLPEGLRGPGRLTAQVTYTAEGRLSVREMLLDLGGNQLRGAVDVRTGDVPQIMAELTAGTLTLPQRPGGGSGQGRGGASASGWSEAAIDASILSLAEGAVGLRFDRIEAPGLALGPGRLLLTVERARAVLQLDSVSVFGGTVRGQLVANNRSGLSVGGQLSAERVELREFLGFAAGVDRLSGQADGEIRFLGVGRSEAEIMRSLSGEGRMQMGQGVISGIDLDRLVTGDPRKGGTTVFNSLTGSFTMAGGNLDNRDLLLLLDNYQVRGAGRIGIGMRDFDYLLTPVALRANAGKGLAVPVRIRGPWSGPSYEPDLRQLLESELEIDLEAEAKEQIRQKLEQELDRPLAEGESIEDAIRDRLEEEAKRGLLRLFGGD